MAALQWIQLQKTDRRSAQVQHGTALGFIETYGKLKQEAGDNEPILFIDGVHPTQGTKLAYSWMRKGQKTAMKTTGSSTRI